MGSFRGWFKWLGSPPRNRPWMEGVPQPQVLRGLTITIFINHLHPLGWSSKVRSFTATSPLEKRIPGPQKGEDHLPVLWLFIIFQEFLPLNFRGVWELFEIQRRNLFMKWGETELSLSPLFFTHAMFDFYVVRKEMLYVRCWTPLLEPLKKGIIYPINADYCHYITCYIGWIFKGFPTIFPMILSNIQQPRGSHPGAPYLWDLAKLESTMSYSVSSICCKRSCVT